MSVSLSASIKAGTIAAIVTLGTVAANPEPAHALACHNKSISGGAIAPGHRKHALGKARSIWISRVKSELGNPWTEWGLAKNRSIKCKLLGTTSNGQQLVSCTRRARPCMPSIK